MYRPYIPLSPSLHAGWWLDSDCLVFLAVNGMAFAIRQWFIHHFIRHGQLK
jgi:hypothetical protein